MLIAAWGLGYRAENRRVAEESAEPSEPETKEPESTGAETAGAEITGKESTGKGRKSPAKAVKPEKPVKATRQRKKIADVSPAPVESQVVVEPRTPLGLYGVGANDGNGQTCVIELENLLRSRRLAA